VASHLPVDDDRLDGDGVVAANRRPVRLESSPVRWVLAVKAAI